MKKLMIAAALVTAFSGFGVSGAMAQGPVWDSVSQRWLSVVQPQPKNLRDQAEDDAEKLLRWCETDRKSPAPFFTGPLNCFHILLGKEEWVKERARHLGMIKR